MCVCVCVSVCVSANSSLAIGPINVIFGGVIELCPVMVYVYFDDNPSITFSVIDLFASFFA